MHIFTHILPEFAGENLKYLGAHPCFGGKTQQRHAALAAKEEIKP